MTASEQIDQYIAGLTDWRGQMVAELRRLIQATDNSLTEEWKWNSPAWAKKGTIVSISAFKDHVGVNFFQGAALPDPHMLFNGGLESKRSRAINLREGNEIDKAAFQDLVRSAAALSSR